MALKIKRIKIGYQWRLFFPLIGLLWAIIAGMMLWQYKHEEDIRFEEVRKQMNYINARAYCLNATSIQMCSCYSNS